MEQQFIERDAKSLENSLWANVIQMYLNILNDLDIQIKPNARILDFGCGAGNLVYQFRKMGFNAFGVDIKSYINIQDSSQSEEAISIPEGIFHTIDTDKYQIPFEDNTFDFVFSNQVFEHVQNFSEALGEIKRVLKPGGYSLHLFPSKYRPVEGHIYVPFAGIFQEYVYLLFWSFLGIRNEYQKGLNFREVAALNFEYIKTGTNYLSPAQVSKYFNEHFKDVCSVETLFIKHSFGRLRHIYFLTKIFPFVPFLVKTFHERVILVRKS